MAFGPLAISEFGSLIIERAGVRRLRGRNGDLLTRVGFQVPPHASYFSISPVLRVPDFTTTEGVLTFAAGSVAGATRSIDVPLLNDTVDEDDETFHVDLTRATGGVVGTTAGRTTVTLMDAPPTLTLTSGIAVPERDSGTSLVGVTLTLSAVLRRGMQSGAA